MSDKAGIILTSVGGNYTPDAPHELAWQHSQSLVDAGTVEVGSDEFVEAYQELVDQYQMCLDRSGFLQFMSMRIIRELFRTGDISLVITTGDGYGEASDKLSKLSHILTSALMYLLVLEEDQWVLDIEWNMTPTADRSIYFPITIPEVQNDTDE